MFKYHRILVILLFTSIIMMIFGLLYRGDIKDRIIYKYVKPNSFENDMANTPYVSDVFKSMFSMSPLLELGIYNEYENKQPVNIFAEEKQQ